MTHRMRINFPLRGLVAGWIAAWAMVSAFLPVFPGSPALVFSVVLVFSGLLSGLAAGFFLRTFRHPPPAGLREIALGFGLTAGFGLGTGIILAAAGQLEHIGRNIPSVLAALILAPVVFFAARLFTVIWNWWNAKRRRRLLFSMIHTHLIVAVVVGGLAMAAGIGWIGYGVWQDQEVWNSLPNPGYSLFAIVLLWALIVLVLSAAVFLGVIVVLLPPSFLLSYAMARRITRRVEQLSLAAQEMERGNLSISTPVEGNDEVAHLQSVFNSMAVGLRESAMSLKQEKDKVAVLLDAQRNLTVGAAHELRTPVATISSYLESILHHWRERPADQVKDDLEVLSREVEELRKLLDDLFVLESVQLRKLNFEYSPVEPGEAVRLVVRALAPVLWNTSRVEVTAEVAHEPPSIRADPRRLSQILKNLVVNAARHTPPGGFVCVSARQEPDAVCFEVADSGEGIPADALPRVWEPFFKADSSAEGAGLGLALVKEFAETMGGSAAVRSDPGQGTVFMIRFPLEKNSP